MVCLRGSMALKWGSNVTVCSVDWSMLQHMTHGERVRKRYAEWRLACSQGHNPTVWYTRYLPVIRLVRYTLP